MDEIQGSDYEKERENAKNLDRDITEIACLSYRPGTTGKNSPDGVNPLMKYSKVVYEFNSYSTRFHNDAAPPKHNINPLWVDSVFSPVFIQLVQRMAPSYVHVPLGNAREDDEDEDKGPPAHLQVTQIRMKYQQKAGENYCLGYSMASCLHYMGFVKEAKQLHLVCKQWAHLPGGRSLQMLSLFMQKNVKVIGDCLLFQQRTSNRRKKSVRKLTPKCLYDELTPYPTVVLLEGSDGSVDHAVTVIDNLVFDSTVQHPLRVCLESLKWICGGEVESIVAARRFFRPHGTKQKLNREVKHY